MRWRKIPNWLRIQELEKRFNLAEQYSRCSNLEIQGVVKQEGENVAGILAKLGDTIDESITESNIESCHRVPTRHPDK